MTALEMRDASAEGRLVKTDFKSFLYWRDHGFPEAGVRDGFGSALIRARDGAILLGRQSAGHINSGMTYLPGGFIDDRDVGADGIVRLGDSIAREVAEETGLELADLVPSDGFLVTRAGPQVSFARTFLSPLDGEALARRVREFLSRQSGAELADVVLVREPADCASLAMPAFARHLLPVVLRAP
ncbi:MAG: NUDIX hydrolase [Hyphomicrobiaceae bacterium]|nr:NUDIX hydrolase [Hyphomicrobiaceae bacterium]